MPRNRSFNTRSSRALVVQECRTNDQCGPREICTNRKCVPGMGISPVPDMDACNTPGGSVEWCNDCCFTQYTLADCTAANPLNQDYNCVGSCEWYSGFCEYGNRKGGKINKRNNRRNTMRRRGGRTRPKPRGRGRAMARGGRKMPGGGRTCGGMGQPPCPGGGYRKGGRPAPRKMARGGRTRPAPRGRGRRFQAGGHSHNIGHSHTTSAHGEMHYPQMDYLTASGSFDVTNGSHQHPGGIPGPNRRPLIPGRKRGGRVTHQLRRGGRAPMRRFQAGGAGGECPVGTQRSAYGTCLPLDA